MMASAILLLLCLLGTTQLVASNDRFLVTAPSVFHVGVKEKVSVQLGQSRLNSPVLLYLEHEISGELMSKKVPVDFSNAPAGTIKHYELEILNKPERLTAPAGSPAYLLLVCEIKGQRKPVRVLVSKHKGYIFIQTDQPVYNPDQKVRYRIYTLDHVMRPHQELIYVSITNAGGNRIRHSTVRTTNGIVSKNFDIPDVSEPGTWRITAHYEGDEENAATREFKVQKFVLPSFVASIRPQQNFYLAKSKDFRFSIEAKYSYGENVNGAYHSRFGLKNKGGKIIFIRGIEQAGSLKNGKADVSMSNFEKYIEEMNTTIPDLAEEEAKLYVAVSVTDINSGELQETEGLFPIVLHPYLVDLSRVHSHFLPGLPFEPAVVIRFPNGSPAPGIQAQIEVPQSQERQCHSESNKDGVVDCAFNLPTAAMALTFIVTVEGSVHQRNLSPASAASGSFLYINAISKVVPVGESLKVQFKAVNSEPEDGFFYYMIFSKGELRHKGSERATSLTLTQIQVSHDMVPSFRLVAYFYHPSGDIISNSIWVDVQDACQGTISLSRSGGSPHPGKSTKVTIDLGGQAATVALLAVDKAIYGVSSSNKLTPKQVFSSMQSYDLGCSYGGGSDTAAVFNDAGLAFISSSTSNHQISRMRRGFSCESGFRRQTRSLDLQKKMTEKEMRYEDKRLQKCCHSGLVLIPMQLTCEERAERVRTRHAQDCVDAFLECCREGKLLRDKKRLEDKRKGLGRSASAGDIEDFFDNEVQTIRQYFPPSFNFDEITVDGKKDYHLTMPDSITTWEIQSVSLSQSHGICVAEPLDIKVFKDVFLSLRLPYSVKRFEQLSIPVVVYNYGSNRQELAIHMKQAEGLCSPAAKTSNSYQRITVEANSATTVTFPAVPMTFGEIPIMIQLYSTEIEFGVDAITKMLSVKPEGLLSTKEETFYLNMDGRSDSNYIIQGEFPNNTVPDSGTNVFVKIEGEIFGKTSAVPMLEASKVRGLINAPMGCAEQTMMLMSPTALSLRYLDGGNHWHDLPAGMRDRAIDSMEKGYERILTYKKNDGSYGAWREYPSSTWLTALVVKVLSLLAARQNNVEQARPEKVITERDIQQSVQYLLNIQKKDGSFSDPNPVIHREMQGGIGGEEEQVSLTAFITVAIHHSLPFLRGAKELKEKAESSISNSTEYLLARVEHIESPFALAITAYCLSTCTCERSLSRSAWEKLKSKVTKEGECKVWRASFDLDERGSRYITAEALTVETTAYALMTAVAQEDAEWANDAACYLATRENYRGGWKSTQDTIVALEALMRYATSQPESPISRMNVLFQVPGKSVSETLATDASGLSVETDLKRLVGNSIRATVQGEGKAKMKVVKVFHVYEPETSCDDVAISVTVKGKVEYTEEIQKNYEYEDYGDYDEERREEEDVPRTAIEWFDIRNRRKRDTKQSEESLENIKYTVCVSHKLERNLSGMAVADITLLSGFSADRADLDKLKDGADQYISHYEKSHNRVLLYFNEIPKEGKECISFGAKQIMPIGLIQPAPAAFYDYYDPGRRCDIFYSAPKRSKMISQLCSEDVCECAERPCFKEKTGTKIKKSNRFDHACYDPVVEYGFEVLITSVEKKSSFELYIGTVTSIFRTTGDTSVGQGDTRVFAKRMACKGSLAVGKTYLIMGYDGPTKDTAGQMQYLLDSRTWVEEKPTNCKASTRRKYCRGYEDFTTEYQINGCTQ
ncbi:complement C4-B [Engraulis encrasicolus]|uniref:complement C4-B n=1 Tax=Engraulis encrasicolus TaxID=184585 RepID=UPI002FD71C1E